MTPLDAAKAIFSQWEPYERVGAALGTQSYAWTFCGGAGAPMANAHAEDCPWLYGPQIIAALEAAERFARLHDITQPDIAGGGMSFFSSNTTYAREDALQALVAALKGDEA